MTGTATHDIPVGNHYDKYNSKNPIARLMMSQFTSSLERLIAKVSPKQILEVGCGEGHLVPILSKFAKSIRATDFSPEIIAVAQREQGSKFPNVVFEAKSIYDLEPPRDSAELVVCCEVLEHLEDPRRALRVLSSIASPYLVTSVPREPIWRALNMARLKYLSDFGNTPGHIQHWSKAGFLKLLSTEFEVMEVASPFPWTMALCRRKNS